MDFPCWPALTQPAHRVPRMQSLLWEGRENDDRQPLGFPQAWETTLAISSELGSCCSCSRSFSSLFECEYRGFPALRNCDKAFALTQEPQEPLTWLAPRPASSRFPAMSWVKWTFSLMPDFFYMTTLPSSFLRSSVNKILLNICSNGIHCPMWEYSHFFV